MRKNNDTKTARKNTKRAPWLRDHSGKNPHDQSRSGERGNVFFALFGAVAVVGVLGAGIMATMRGPLSTMVEVQNRAEVDAEMSIAGKLVLLEASQGTDDGDCDGDNYVEPLAFLDVSPQPTGGGQLPAAVSSNKQDPWGVNYGYCSWDPGGTTDAAGCGGASQDRLAGGVASEIVIAVISAGPDKTFQTTCTESTTPTVTKTSGSDDYIKTFTYNEAVTATAGLWSIKSGEPSVATIDKEIEVEGDIDLNRGGAGTGQLILGASSMILPTQAELSSCTSANDLLLRIDDSVSPPVLQMCHWNGASGAWVLASGDDIWQEDGADIYFQSQVGIGTGMSDPQYTLDVAGTLNATGAAILGSTLDLGGNLQMANTNSVVWDSGADITEASGALEIDANGGTGVELDVDANDITIIADVEITGSTANNTAAALDIKDSASGSLLFVRNDGNVGIGTATPGSTLTVSGTGTFSNRLGVGTTGPSYKISVVDALSSTTQFTSDAIAELVNTDTTANNWLSLYFTDEVGGAASTVISTKYTDHTNNYGELHFSTRGAGGLSSQLIIDEDGNVGIGITNPNDALDVSGDGDFTGSLSAGSTVVAGGTVTAGVSTHGNNAFLINDGSTAVVLGPPAECSSAQKLDWDDNSGWTCQDDIGATGTSGGQTIAEILANGDDAGGADLEGLDQIGAASFCDAGKTGCVAHADLQDAQELDGENLKSTLSTDTTTTGQVLAWDQTNDYWEAQTLSQLGVNDLGLDASVASSLCASGTVPISDGTSDWACGDASAIAGTPTIAIDDLTDATKDTSDNNLFLAHTGGSAGDNNDYNTAVGIAALDALNNDATQAYYGDNNSAFGHRALTANTSGYGNSAFGRSALDFTTTGYQNTAVGYVAAYLNTIGAYNTAFGHASLYSNVAKGANTAIGNQAMYYADDDTTAASTYNTALGFQSLRGSATASDNTGTHNTAVGASTMIANTSGSVNVAVGYTAMAANTTGARNTGVGTTALNATTTGSDNVALGYWSLVRNTTGQRNIAIGSFAGQGSTGASDISNNVILGYQAGVGLLTGGNDNTLLGYQAGDAITTGARNIIIGSGVDIDSATNSDYLNIGNAFFGEMGDTTSTSDGGADLTIDGNLTVTGSFSGGIAIDDLSDAAKNTTDNNLFMAHEGGSVGANDDRNTGIGIGALDGLDNSTGTDNTALGYNAGTAVDAGDENVFIGTSAGTATTSGSANLFAGFGAGSTNVSGNYNVYLGRVAGGASTGSGGVYIGDEAGRYSTANHNTLIGFESGKAASGAELTGTGNTFVGYQTGLVNTSGASNTFIGYAAGDANTTGSVNLFLGNQAGGSNTTGSSNTFLNSGAGIQNTEGDFNVAISRHSLRYNTTGDSNTVVGYEAGQGVSGSSNIAQNALLGAQAGLLLQTGADDNTLLGYQAGVAVTTGADNIVIGSGAASSLTTGSDNIILGSGVDIDSATNSDYLNIGNALFGEMGDTTSTSDGGASLTLDGDLTVTGTLSGTIGIDDLSDAAYNTTSDNLFLTHEGGSVGSNDVRNIGIGTGALSGLDNSTGINNTALGYNAGNANTEGDNNVFIGYNAGVAVTTSNQNVFLGASSGAATTTGNNNVFIGMETGDANETGYSNVYIGRAAGTTSTAGTFSVLVGQSAGGTNTSNSQNVFIGYQAGESSGSAGASTFVGTNAGRYATASYNTLLGYEAGFASSGSPLTGTDNTFVGFRTGLVNTSGASNTFIGDSAGTAVSTGSYNTFLGAAAGDAVTTASNNTFLGYLAGSAADTGANNVALGSNAGLLVAGGASNTLLGYQAGDAITSGNRNIIIGSGVDIDSATNSDYLNIGNALFGEMGDTTSTSDGGADLTVDGDLTVTGTISGTQTALADADGDTLVQVEESSDEDKIRFDTAGTERMVIDENGNITMGQNAPISSVRLVTSTDATVTRGYYNVDMVAGGYTHDLGVESGAGYLNLKDVSAGVTRIDSDGDSYFMGGNVGIGTSTPSAPLHLSQSGNALFQLSGTSSTAWINAQSGGYFNVLMNSGNAQHMTVGRAGSSIAGSVRNIIQFMSDDTINIRTGSSGTLAVKIDASQNVGIGTTSPAYQVEVADSSGGVVSISTNGAAGSLASPLESSLSYLGYNDLIRGEIAVEDKSVNQKGGWMNFRTADSSNVLQDRMIIDRDGNVGIGTTSPDASALLDVSSTTKGFLPPRMTSAQVAAISSPANGLLVYDSDVGRYKAYQAGAWQDILTTATGNVTDDSLDFDKFEDAMDLDASTSITAPSGQAYVLSITNEGTGNSFLVEDEASDSTPFVIAADGKVGIGEAAPSYKVDIEQAADFTGLAVRGFDDVDTKGVHLYVDSLGQSNIAGLDSSPLVYLANDHYFRATTGSMYIGVAGGDYKYRIASAGISPHDSDNTYDLGLSSLQWRDLHLGRDAYIGNSIGLATDSPSYLLSLGGDEARTIGMERESATAGNNLTVLAGGAVSGGTDLDGGDLILSSGTATGDGSSSIVFQTVQIDQGAGTDDRAPATAMTVASNALTIPSGPTSQQPGATGMQASVAGMIRYDTTLNKYQAYQDGAWQDILTTASGNITDDSLDFDKFVDAMNLDASTSITADGTEVLSIVNTGTGNSFLVEDTSSDSTPFSIDASGNVNIGGDVTMDGSSGTGNWYIRDGGTEELQIGSTSTTKTVQMELYHAVNPVSLGIDYDGGAAHAYIESVHPSYDVNTHLQFRPGGTETWRIGSHGTGGTYADSFEIQPVADTNDFYLSNASGTPLFYSDTSAGYIGIGTASPLTQMHMRNASASSYLTITSGTASTAGIYLGDTGDPDIAQINYLNGSDALQFITNTSEAMRVDSAGSVGIGTSSPGYLLDVNGRMRARSGFSTYVGDGVFGASATPSFISLPNNDTLKFGYFSSGDGRYYGRVGADNSGNSSEVDWGAWAEDVFTIRTATTERMRIDSSGNIGIGTSTPDSKLHVTDSSSSTSNYSAVEIETTRSATTTVSGANYMVNSQATLSGTGGSFINSMGIHNLTTISSTGTSTTHRAIVNRVNMSGSGAAAVVALNATHFEGSSSGTISKFYGHVVGNTGDQASAFTNSSSTITNTYGIYIADLTAGTQTNTPYGIYQSDTGIRNYFGGQVGIGESSPGVSLHITSTSDTNIFRLQDSDGTCNHNPESGSVIISCSSDIRLKTEIAAAAPVLDYLDKFDIKDYTVKASGSRMTGVIAQELQEVYPELVHEGDDGILTVDQPNPWKLVKAVQELKAEVEDLRDQKTASVDSEDYADIAPAAGATDGGVTLTVQHIFMLMLAGFVMMGMLVVFAFIMGRKSAMNVVRN